MHATSVMAVSSSENKALNSKCPFCHSNDGEQAWMHCSKEAKQCLNCGAVINSENKVIVKGETR